MRLKSSLLTILCLCLLTFVLVDSGCPHADVAGVRGVCPKLLKKYMKRIAKLRYNFEWNPSVQKLAGLINNDPALRYNWEYGISQSKNLACYTSKDVFGMLNAILNVGPAYDTSGLVGFPINVLFVHLMQNQNGRTLFANAEVNAALRDVVNDYGEMLLTNKSLTYMNKRVLMDGFRIRQNKR